MGRMVVGAHDLRRGFNPLSSNKGKSPEKCCASAFKADRITSEKIRYGFITVKSITLIGLNSPLTAVLDGRDLMTVRRMWDRWVQDGNMERCAESLRSPITGS
ncbi:hypothetical protein TNCV_3378681 [Trichonephila clavipes]|nr:hypothetical protein TNCV_3378681 [Trichonephila clavipes]